MHVAPNIKPKVLANIDKYTCKSLQFSNGEWSRDFCA